MNQNNELTWTDYRRDMRARRCSPATIEKNRRGIEQLAEHAGGADLLTLAKADIQDWIVSMDEWAPSSVLTRFSSARAFYNWCESEEMIKRSPMARMAAPANPAVLIDMPPLDDVRALLKACAGKTFEDRRDTAMIRVMCEAGAPRASEAANIVLSDLDLDHDDLTVYRGKGGKTRVMPLPAVTARACSRYLRARAGHPKAGEVDRLFIGNGGRGAMTRYGVGKMLARRSAEAGITPVHPHQLRHLAVDRFFAAGGREGDAMRLFGWDDPAMARRYAAAHAANRAQDAARAIALGDAL